MVTLRKVREKKIEMLPKTFPGQTLSGDTESHTWDSGKPLLSHSLGGLCGDPSKCAGLPVQVRGWAAVRDNSDHSALKTKLCHLCS